MGYFKIEELDSSVQSAIIKLKQGDFSKIITTDNNYQIFKLEEVKVIPPKTVEQVSSQISKKLYNEKVNIKYNEWMENLKKNAHIKIIN